LMNAPRSYLDYNASAPLRAEVREAMLKALDVTGNPSSIHAHGRSGKALMEEAREHVAALVGGDARNVIFTSGGTESNNLILNPRFSRGKDMRNDAVLLMSASEHPCVLKGHRFAPECVEVIPVDSNGLIDIARFEERCAQLHAKQPQTKIITSLHLANNETGVIQPVAQIAEIVHRYDGVTHTDTVQAAGKITVSLWGLGVDALTLSAHKIGGPQGVGALVLGSSGVDVGERLLKGGGQERGARAGTENVAGIVGFGVAAQIALRELENEQKRLEILRTLCHAHIMRIAPDAVIFGENAQRLPNTICFAHEGIKAQTALMSFDLAGVSLSSGSACSSGKVKSSHVLEAMGVQTGLLEAALRISIGWGTTEHDIEHFASAFSRIVENAKKRVA
jgi:cysteine desulfurase